MAKFTSHTNAKPRSATAGLWGSLVMFAIVVVIFIAGTDSLSTGTNRRQKESLANAISRDVVYCYATTGKYPESLDFIRENYGLYYNEDLFYVDYKIRGSNLMPDVTIIELSPEENASFPQRAKAILENAKRQAASFKASFKHAIQNRRKQGGNTH